MTENDMVGLLQARYTRYRLGTNADRYVRARQVRYPNTRVFNETVFTAGQAVAIADYLVQDMYGQCPLIGFEIKVSRSDWLAELRNPGKAQWWRVTVTSGMWRLLLGISCVVIYRKDGG